MNKPEKRRAGETRRLGETPCLPLFPLSLSLSNVFGLVFVCRWLFLYNHSLRDVAKYPGAIENRERHDRGEEECRQMRKMIRCRGVSSARLSEEWQVLRTYAQWYVRSTMGDHVRGPELKGAFCILHAGGDRSAQGRRYGLNLLRV